jgi:hypothetical protein
MTHSTWIQTLMDTFTYDIGYKPTPQDGIPFTVDTVDNGEHPQFEAWLAKKSVDDIINLYNLSK